MLSRLDRQMKRLRHKRGHGVHSPYIYSIVREVFMRRELTPAMNPLYDTLVGVGLKRRYARELENMRHHCGFSTFDIDSLEQVDMVICTTKSTSDQTLEIVRLSKERGTTVVFVAPHLDTQREQMSEGIVAKHHSTTLDRRGYLVIFNNHLPKQHFIL